MINRRMTNFENVDITQIVVAVIKYVYTVYKFVTKEQISPSVSSAEVELWQPQISGRF